MVSLTEMGCIHPRPCGLLQQSSATGFSTTAESVDSRLQPRFGGSEKEHNRKKQKTGLEMFPAWWLELNSGYHAYVGSTLLVYLSPDFPAQIMGILTSGKKD